jgi:hypothetical protein
MTEKTQRTAAGMRLKMVACYGDEQHKHNKDHLHFGPHKKLIEQPVNGAIETLEGHEHWSSKKMQEFKNRKTRKRLDKGHFH